MKKKTLGSAIIATILLAVFGLPTYYYDDIKTYIDKQLYIEEVKNYHRDDIPEHFGDDYVIIDDNIPNFSPEELNLKEYESYSELDPLGRCGVAMANISLKLMPTEERGAIGQIKPSGWQTIKYDIVDGNYLYNRCHLIGYQLTGENANEKNLITCTRQMNIGSMLDFENKVAEYIKQTNNHVLYRVTPVYDGTNLLAKGVQMEAYSIEDNGKGIQFNVFIYNVQDGISINYANGESELE